MADALQEKIIVFLASGCGTGHLPRMPGTWGSLVGLPLAMILARLQPLAQSLCLVGLVVLAIWLAGRAELIIGEVDASVIVVDEIGGVLVSLFLLPASWKTLVAGFVLFRLFDIAKVPPVNLVERHFSGGVAVVLDDVVAGIMANFGLRLLLAFGVVP